MKVLVFNCGSSSLNYKVFSNTGDGLQVICRGKAHRVGVQGSEPAFIEHIMPGGNVTRQVRPIPDHRTAANLSLDALAEIGIQVELIGHRFVHGGEDFQASTWLTHEALVQLQRTLPLAPIHNPNSLSVIEACEERLPGVSQYLTFDTAFHAGLPAEATTYAIPEELRRIHGYRKYGFHGLSYQYVVTLAAQYLGRPLVDLRLVACHLGTGGSSVVALEHGKPADTSMGYSPLGGLIMSTRTGDLDPLLSADLIDRYGYNPQALMDLFNKKSGLLGVSGFSSDIRDLLKAIDARQDARARLAFDMYTQRLKKTIGSYAVLLGGLDVLIFTDDIGVQNPRVREAACRGMAWCGIVLDETANLEAPSDHIAVLSSGESAVKVLSIPTDEELVIGQEGYRMWVEANHAAL